MNPPPMVQPTVSIQRTDDGVWRCVLPRSSTPFLIPYLRRKGLPFTSSPGAAEGMDQFDFPGTHTLAEMKALMRGFGARVLRPGEENED